MLTIHTHSTNPLHAEFWKWAVRTVTQRYSGPDAVRDSLTRGLSMLTIPYRVDTRPQTDDTLLVLSGVSALKHAIRLRADGTIKKLIAGPNVVMHPSDAKRIMCNDAIDLILVPSSWVQEFWKHEAPELASKLHVWPAGTAIAPASTRTGLPIIYDKLGDATLLEKARDAVGEHRYFTYGTFIRSAYLTALSDAPYLVYLAHSESQGLALQEAWAHDVPTFVNHSTHWEHGGCSWEAQNINCPYLTPELGAVFENSEELRIMISSAHAVHPKEYCDMYLSDKASAEALLKLL